MSQNLISRRNFLLITAGTTIISSHLGGCSVIGRTVLIRVAPRLGKVFGVLLNIADGAMTIAALIDTIKTSLNVNVARQDAIYLKDGARLIIEDGGGRQFLVSFDLLNDNSSSQKDSPYSRSMDENQRPASLKHLDDNTQRLNFSRGATSASVSGLVKSNSLRRYILGARKGQTMKVILTSKSSKFDLYFQKRGNPLTKGSKSWQGRLPKSGDYVINIYSFRNDNYKLFASII